MDLLTDIEGTEGAEEDLNQIIITTCQYYLRGVSAFSSPNGPSILGDKKKDIKHFLDSAFVNFKKLNKTLSYARETLEDAENIQGFRSQIRTKYGQRNKSSNDVCGALTDAILQSKLPTINPEIASCVLNEGNYDFLQLKIKGVSNFEDQTQRVHQMMERIIQNKLCLSRLPAEELSFSIKEGVLTVSGVNFSFELTLLYDQKKDDYNWFLLFFEHKLLKRSHIEKKIERLNNEISKIYTESKREQEAYVILFIVHKLKYFYSRKRLKSIIKEAEVFQTQLEHFESEEVFHISSKKVSKEMIFFEVSYWRNSLLHTIDPNHRFNCLFFQLVNHSFATFVDQYLIDGTELFSGLNSNEVSCVYHEPHLFSNDSVDQVINLMEFNRFPQSARALAILNKILLFDVSRKCRFNEITLESSFIQIFSEVKKLLSAYQLIHYYSILSKIPNIQNSSIYLYTKDTSNSLSRTPQFQKNELFLGVEVEQQKISLSIDQNNGGVDFGFDCENKGIQIYKSKFQKLLQRNPLQFPQVIILFKKLLLLSSFNQFLRENNWRYCPDKSKNQDTFQIVKYQCHEMHISRLDGVPKIVQAFFAHQLYFDQTLENANISSKMQFSISDPQNPEYTQISDQSSIKLVPFDCNRIAKELKDMLTTKKLLALFRFEHHRLETRKGGSGNSMNNGKSVLSLNDLERFSLPLSQNLEQSLAVVNNDIVITIRPNFPQSESFISYINAHEGTKIVFDPQYTMKAKTCEIFERNKLTLKYSKILDGLTEIQKDGERLENLIKQRGFEREEDNDQSLELHSLSVYKIGRLFALRFLDDKLFDIQPSKYKHLKLGFDGVWKEEKEREFHKKLCIKEMWQILPTIELAHDLERKLDWVAELNPRAQQTANQNGNQNTENQAPDPFAKLVEATRNCVINIQVLDPWHYVLNLKKYKDCRLNGRSFYLYFQLISEYEHECLELCFENVSSIFKRRIDEKTKKIYFALQTLFRRFTRRPNQMANGVQNTDLQQGNGGGGAAAAANSSGWRINFENRSGFLKFLGQLILFLNEAEDKCSDELS